MSAHAKQQRVVKWIAVAVCAVVVVVCAATSQNMPLTKRGVVIGVGLDRTENMYTVCAQFVLAGASGKPESGSLYEVVEGHGATVMQAFEDVAKKSSLHPSYAHCKVLFVGDSLLNERLDDVMQGLMRSNYLGNVQVIAVQGSAKQTINERVPLFTTTSTYMERDNMLVSKSGGRRLMSIKDYCQRIDGKSGSKFLPYAVRQKAQSPMGETQNEGENEQMYLYDLFHTVAFDGANRAHVYGNRVTQSVGLVEAKCGQFTAYTDDGRYVTVKIDKVRHRRTYRPDTVVGHYRFVVQMVEQTLCADEPSAEDVQRLVAAGMEDAMRQTYEQCKQDGVDIFSVAGHLYKRYGTVVDLQAAKWERHIEVRCK